MHNMGPFNFCETKNKEKERPAPNAIRVLCIPSGCGSGSGCACHVWNLRVFVHLGAGQKAMQPSEVYGQKYGWGSSIKKQCYMPRLLMQVRPAIRFCKKASISACRTYF